MFKRKSARGSSFSQSREKSDIKAFLGAGSQFEGNCHSVKLCVLMDLSGAKSNRAIPLWLGKAGR